MPQARSTQSSLHWAPSSVWGLNCGAVAHADNTNGVSARMKSRLMSILLRGNLSLHLSAGPAFVTRDHTIARGFRLP